MLLCKKNNNKKQQQKQDGLVLKKISIINHRRVFILRHVETKLKSTYTHTHQIIFFAFEKKV